MTLFEIIKAHFGIEIDTYEIVKNIDTIVLKACDRQRQYYGIKLYKLHHPLIAKISKIQPFLKYLKVTQGLALQVPLTNNAIKVNWHGKPHSLIMYPWLYGQKPSIVDTALAFRMGQMMARLHQTVTQYQPNLAILHLDKVFFQGVEVLILAKADVYPFDKDILAKANERIASIFEKYQPSAKNYGLIHSDLHFGNVIYDYQEQLVAIDFDELAYGHFALDIAVTFDEIEAQSDADRLKKYYLEGYVSIWPQPIEILVATIQDFQLLSAFLYLNWLFAPANQELLAIAKYQKIGADIIRKICRCA